MELNTTLFYETGSTLSEAQILALLHAEVQLKQLFWIISENKKFEKEIVLKRWADFQQKVVNYGCHCWTSSGFQLGGSGASALDKLDLSCKEHGRCAKCIEIDRVVGAFSDRNYKCHQHLAYYSKLGKNYKSGERFIQCGKSEDEGGKQSRCQSANCRCDVQFAMDFKNWYK